MQILKETLDALGINAAAAFTGSLGAALAALRMQASTFLSRLVYFGIGVACALWAPPLLVWGFSLPAAPSTYSALGFACGYFGSIAPHWFVYVFGSNRRGQDRACAAARGVFVQR